VAAPRVRLPAAGFGRVEIDMTGRADRIVRVKQHLDGRAISGFRCDRRGDAIAGHVGKVTIKDLSRVCVTLANEAGVQPFLDDAFDLAEEVEFGFFARIAPLGIKQVRGKAVEHGRRPGIAQMSDG